MTEAVKKVDLGTLVGLVVAVFGVLSLPEYADLLGERTAGIVTLVGTILAAVRGAVFGGAK